MLCAEARLPAVQLTYLHAQVGEQDRDVQGGSGQNPYASLIDAAEGLDKIEELQNHNNEDIYEKASALASDDLPLSMC